MLNRNQIPERLNFGQWPNIAKIYPVNAIWLLKKNKCRIKFYMSIFHFINPSIYRVYIFLRFQIFYYLFLVIVYFMHWLFWRLLKCSHLFFSSPGPRVHVSHYHHLVSIVCVCKLFTFQYFSPKFIWANVTRLCRFVTLMVLNNFLQFSFHLEIQSGWQANNTFWLAEIILKIL